jgi:hypothetical protein
LSPRPVLKCSHGLPNATAPYRPPIRSPLPFRRRTGKANACRLLVASRLIQHTGQNRSLNTIRRRFRVNRGHIHFKVFQRSVSLQPQWQNGDAFKLAVWGAADCRPTLEPPATAGRLRGKRVRGGPARALVIPLVQRRRISRAWRKTFQNVLSSKNRGRLVQ